MATSNSTMGTIDPTTGKPLAADAIQRVLFVAAKVHVYQIPPLRSTKGYTAAEWTTRPSIFEARLRIFETEEPTTSLSSARSTSTVGSAAAAGPVRVTIVLEDPKSGELFAAAPYNHASAVSHCVDSSRFFAVRVVGEGGMKATLGIGFEERPEAFDFGVALQDAAKILGLDQNNASGSSSIAKGSAAGAPTRNNAATAADANVKRDYSLKEGETIVVNIGSKGKRAAAAAAAAAAPAAPNHNSGSDEAALFSISPPPPAAVMPILPPPPTAEEIKRKQTAQDMGFDDGEFGEFQ